MFINIYFEKMYLAVTDKSDELCHNTHVLFNMPFSYISHNKIIVLIVFRKLFCLKFDVYKI